VERNPIICPYDSRGGPAGAVLRGFDFWDFFAVDLVFFFCVCDFDVDFVAVVFDVVAAAAVAGANTPPEPTASAVKATTH
jgi:hypothetical protein